MPTDEFSRHVGRYYGKYRGKVSDNVDERFLGTLQVTVPAVFGPDTIVPAAPCLPYGHFFVPPKDTDVWIEFEAGDTASPLWVGVWYPEGAAPVEAQVSPPDHRVIQTPAGHTIEIVDTEGEEQILIRHAKDAFVTIDHDGSVLLADAKGSHLHLDAKDGTATLVEAHGNFLTMGEKGTSVVNPQGTVVDVVDDTVHVSAASVILNGTSVALGSGAAEPTVMGTSFKALWDTLLLHVHPHPMGPTLPMAPPDQLALQLLPPKHLTSSVVVK